MNLLQPILLGLLNVATVLLVVVLHWGIYGVLVGTLVSSAVMNFAALPTYWRKMNLRIDPKLIWGMLGMAIPALLTGSMFLTSCECNRQ